MIGTDRGQFDGGGFTGAGYQDWTLDGLGNFAAFNDDGTSQTRETNEANEIESITTGGNTTDLDYDDAGNMISMPKPGAETTRLFAVYDAWNRLKKVYVDTDDDGSFEPSDGDPAGSDLLWATYEHDGLNRRIEKTTTADAPGGARQVDNYFNENWQLLETRTLAGGTTSVDQYLFDISYIDARVCRWHDADGDGVRDDGDTVRYYTWDANFNVTAAFDGTYNSGLGQFVFGTTPTERYVYATYGEALVYNAAWSNTPTAPTADGPLFAGYWLDAETGLMDMRAREYHSTLSAFIQPDPVEADPNTYRYCENGPTISTDPSGYRMRSRSPAELARLLRTLAAQADPDRFRKHKHGPKKPRPPRTSGKRRHHVSTARILATRKTNKTLSIPA